MPAHCPAAATLLCRPQRLRRTTLLSALGLALLQPAAATPAPPPPQTPPTTDLDAVTVTTQRYEARRDDTASRIVIDRKALGQYGDTQLIDALRRLPGVTLGTPSPGGGASIALRGMGAGYTQLLVDGEPPPAGFNLDALTPEQVERVEIIRAATADQRAEAIGGTLNIVLAASARTPGDTLRATWATASNGTHVPTLAWERSRHTSGRDVGLVVTANRRAFEVIEHGGERGEDPAGNTVLARTTQLRAVGARERLNLAPTLDLQLDEDTTLRLQGTAEGSRFTRTTDIAWDTTLGPPLRHARYRQRTALDVAVLQTSARWQRQLHDGGSVQARFAVGGNRERSAWRELAHDDQDRANLLDHTDATLRVHTLSSSGHRQWLGATQHTVQVGWEASLDRRRDARRQSLHYFGTETDSLLDLAFDAQVRRYALYAQDEFKLGKRASLYAGARLERIESRGDGSGLTPVSTGRQVASPILQTLWRLPGTNAPRLRAALTRTFKAPTLGQLSARPYTNSNNRPLDPDIVGNRQLRPELATGLDLAYERGSGEGRRLSVGGYLRRIEGVIRDDLRQRDGRWISQPVNGGNATAWGLELDGGLPLPALWQGAPTVDLRYSATRTWSRVKQVSGPWNLLPDQTRFIASVAADVRHSERWSCGAAFTYTSSARIQTSATLLEHEAAKSLLDLYVLWRATPGLRLRLSVNDLLRDGPASGATTTLDGLREHSWRQRRGTALWQAQLETSW